MRGFFTILLIAFVMHVFARADSNTDIPLRTKSRFFVMDKKTRLPLQNVEINISSPKDPVLKKGLTNASGIAEVVLLDGISYRVEYTCNSRSEKDRYFAHSKTFTKRAGINIDTTGLEKIEKIVCYGSFPNIYFNSNSAIIEDTATLNMWLSILVENPTLEVELSGHTDCRGTKQGNLSMSQKRVDAIVDYMFRHGISKKRMVAKGWGDERPVNGCNCKPSQEGDCDEAQYARNRRVEIKFTKL